MSIKTNTELVGKLVDVAKNYKTLYVMGCFGAPMTSGNKIRYCNNHIYNKNATRQKMIKSASDDTFGFDCVCLIKGVLWGWNGDASKSYGGATYNSNGVPDTNADGLITLCKNVSTNFSNIEVGECLWMKGHVGIYIGDGLAVECTPSWENKVQITAVKNIGAKKGYNARTWTKHGKLPYITYEKTEPTPSLKSKTVEDIAYEVLEGKWGNGQDRINRLTKAGYNAKEVQTVVNNLVKNATTTKKSNEEIAREVIKGKWGNGAERKKNLIAAGYDPVAIQKIVNKIL